jgi:hypothetical protein
MILNVMGDKGWRNKPEDVCMGYHSEEDTG